LDRVAGYGRKVALRHRMAKRAREGKISSVAENFERRAQEDEARARLLRQFLLPEEEKVTRTSENGRENKKAAGRRKAASATKKRKRQR
jgi:hypothetical protein